MKHISVILITLNEEDNIKACLEGIKWADEIVVVDAFSSDKTPDICREYTNKFLQRDWDGYAGQKNFALKQARNEWILWVDADEVVTEDLKCEIQKAVQENNADGFFIPRKNYFLGKWMRHGGWHPDFALRLFKGKKAYFEEREVHEKVILDGKTSVLKHSLLHYTYKSLDDYVERQNRYASLAAKELYLKGIHKGVSAAYLVFKFFGKFIETYIYKRGFLDGYYGLLTSVSASYFAFLKYAKLKESVRVQGKNDPE